MSVDVSAGGGSVRTGIGAVEENVDAKVDADDADSERATDGEQADCVDDSDDADSDDADSDDKDIDDSAARGDRAKSGVDKRCCERRCRSKERRDAARRRRHRGARGTLAAIEVAAYDDNDSGDDDCNGDGDDCHGDDGDDGSDQFRAKSAGARVGTRSRRTIGNRGSLYFITICSLYL